MHDRAGQGRSLLWALAGGVVVLYLAGIAAAVALGLALLKWPGGALAAMSVAGGSIVVLAAGSAMTWIEWSKRRLRFVVYAALTLALMMAVLALASRVGWSAPGFGGP